MKFLFENFDVLAQAPGGVKKLREMILQFAVQGKLVPQDPDDEPVGVLLEKIKAEKERLIKEGKIKKQKPLETILEDEIPYELPKGWVWTNLDTLGFINPRNSFEDNKKASFVPMPLIFSEYGKPIQTQIKLWSEIKKGYTHFAENDVALAKITPCFENKKSAVMKGLTNGVGAGTTELHIFRPFEQTLFPEYVLIFLKTPKFIDFGKTKMTGSAGQKRVPKEYFSQTPFPLPPLAEQKRIVAKVDSLMALCDDLEKQQQEKAEKKLTLNKASLHALNNSTIKQDFNKNWGHIKKNFDLLYSTSENVNDLKQTILQLAVQGKLVPQNPDDEPAGVLLEKIKEEKELLVKEGKIKKQKPLEPIRDDEIPYELPKGWKWCRFIDITKVITCGIASTPKYSENGMPFLSAKNVKPFRFLPQDYKFVSKDTYRKIIQNAKPEINDILLTRVGAGIGEAALIDIQFDFAYYVSLTLIKPFHDFLNPKYLLFYLSSPLGILNSISNVYGKGVSQGNLNVNQVRKFVVPLPPLAEQKRIVAKVDSLMALCDKLSRSLADKETKSEKMLNAVVNQL